MDVTKPCEFIGFRAMDVTKPNEFIGFGVIDVTKPYKFMRFWDAFFSPDGGQQSFISVSPGPPDLAANRRLVETAGDMSYFG